MLCCAVVKCKQGGCVCVCACKCVNVSAARDKAVPLLLLQLHRPLMGRSSWARERAACPSVSGQVEMLNAFNKSQREWRMRAWPATGRGDLSGQHSTDLSYPSSLPPPVPFFAFPAIWPAATEFLLIYARKWRCLVIGFCYGFFLLPCSRFICRQLAIQFRRCFDKYWTDERKREWEAQGNIADNFEWRTNTGQTFLCNRLGGNKTKNCIENSS